MTYDYYYSILNRTKLDKGDYGLNGVLAFHDLIFIGDMPVLLVVCEYADQNTVDICVVGKTPEKEAQPGKRVPYNLIRDGHERTKIELHLKEIYKPKKVFVSFKETAVENHS